MWATQRTFCVSIRQFLCALVAITLLLMSLVATEPASAQVVPDMYEVVDFGSGSTALEIDPVAGAIWSANVATGGITVYAAAGSAPGFDVIDSGGGLGQVGTPSGIAITGNEVLVSEYWNNRIQVFNRGTGTHSRFVTTLIDNPCGIEVVGNNVWTYSDENSEISVYTLAGVHVQTFDGATSGAAFSPFCPLDIITADDQHVYVFDDGRVVVYNHSGVWQYNIASGVEVGAIDYADGHLWIVDATGDRVLKWTTAGTFTGEVETFNMDDPRAILADPSGDTIWVGEQAGARIKAFTSLLCVGQQLTMVATSFDDLILGTSGRDVIHLGLGNDRFFAGNGNDWACGGFGTDVLHGEDGNDRLYGDQNSDQVFGGDGRDVLRGGAQFDRLYGEADNDFIYGDANSDLAYGGPGDDTMFGSYGNDRLFGQGGNDTIYGEGNDDKVYGGTGSDVLYGGTGADRIWGENGHDTIFGESGDDTWLDGDDHNDKVYGGGGNDIVRGGDGRDKVYGQGGDDDVRAQAGDDWVTNGGPGIDSCQVAPGIDVPAIDCEP